MADARVAQDRKGHGRLVVVGVEGVVVRVGLMLVEGVDGMRFVMGIRGLVGV